MKSILKLWALRCQLSAPLPLLSHPPLTTGPISEPSAHFSPSFSNRSLLDVESDQRAWCQHHQDRLFLFLSTVLQGLLCSCVKPASSWCPKAVLLVLSDVNGCLQKRPIGQCSSCHTITSPESAARWSPPSQAFAAWAVLTTWAVPSLCCSQSARPWQAPSGNHSAGGCLWRKGKPHTAVWATAFQLGPRYSFWTLKKRRFFLWQRNAEYSLNLSLKNKLILGSRLTCT